MTHVLVFAGTSDGRAVVEFLAGLGTAAQQLSCTVCVATEYGKALLEETPGISVLNGRMDAPGMWDLMAANQVDLVIDATHPYAVAVSANIRKSAAVAGITYLRLIREPSEGFKTDGCEYYPDIHHIVQRLNELDGPILLTTGSKDLPAFTAVRNYRQRIYPRVLPALESLEACRELGFEMSRVIAMQGPFTEELNVALMRQFQIQALVTKESGTAGGYGEKVAAAGKLGVPVLVLARPVQEQGYALEELKAELLRRFAQAGSREEPS